MSMQTDCTYGLGFVLNVGDKPLANFIKAHKDSIKNLDIDEILTWIDEHEKTGCMDGITEEFFDYACVKYITGGLYGIIADIMAAETNIGFEYFHDDETEAIMFIESYPWDLNETEKNLTQDKLREICQKYIKELGGNMKFDYVRIENFG